MAQLGRMFRGLVGKKESEREGNLLMLGLDAAGKTTMLYRMKLNEVLTTVPTIGFNVETCEAAGFNLQFTYVCLGGRCTEYHGRSQCHDVPYR